MHFANAPRTRRLYDILRIKGIAPVEGTEAFRALEDFAALEADGIDALVRRAKHAPMGPIVIHAKGEAQALLAEKDAQIKALAEALFKAGKMDCRRNTTAIEWHTMRCWDGIYAYLRTEGCADKDCEAMRAQLNAVGRL